MNAYRTLARPTDAGRAIAAAALCKAQSDSAAEANTWPNTRLAQFTLRLVDEIERKSDELAGIPAYGDEWKRDVETPVADMLHGLKEALAGFRQNAIDDAAAGYEDDDFADDLARTTISVDDAIAMVRAHLGSGSTVMEEG